jgi:hypothetical protein
MHELFVNKKYLTVPVGVNPATPDTVAVSWNDDPVVSLPVGGSPVASFITSVAVVEEPFPTPNGSQGLVEGL